MAKKHVHRYRRAVLGKDYVVYKCVLPDCTHYLSEQFIIGKKNLCWRCNEPHIITRKLAKPHCVKCTKGFEDDSVVESSVSTIENVHRVHHPNTQALDALLGGVLDDG